MTAIMSSRRRVILAGAIACMGQAVSGQVLFQENFNDGNAAARWTARFGADNGVPDALVELNFDYATIGIPAAPNGAGTRGVRLDANLAAISGPQAAAVNIYPNGQNFTGDFVFRADWYARIAPAGSTTEDSLFGIHASAELCNWFSLGGPASDGVFYSVTEDGGTGSRNDYILYRGNLAGDPAASPLWDNLDPLPMTVFPSQGSGDPGGTPRNKWVAMEIASAGNRIIWRLNGVAFNTLDNNTPFTGGNVFLGHQDLFDSVGPDTFSVFDNVRVLRVARWSLNADGSWDTGPNWSSGVAPNGIDAIAHFGSGITAPRVVTVGSAKTLGDLTFDSAVPYLLAGSQTILFQRGTGTSILSVTDGRHTIAPPVAFASPLIVDVPDPLSQNRGVVLAGGLRQQGPATLTVWKTGAGELLARQIVAGRIELLDGTITLDPGSPTTGSLVNELKIKAHPVFGIAAATLDLRNSGVVIDYSGPSPYATIKSMISTARFANWMSVGITSSVAATTAGTGIGYAEGSALGGRSEFFGFAIDSTSVVVRFTLLGDANLDASVGIGDLAILASAFNSRGDWIKGDFNYDGSANIADFALLAANFNRSLASEFPRVPVPEPAAAALLAGAASVVRRKRRSTQAQ